MWKKRPWIETLKKMVSSPKKYHHAGKVLFRSWLSSWFNHWREDLGNSLAVTTWNRNQLQFKEQQVHSPLYRRSNQAGFNWRYAHIQHVFVYTTPLPGGWLIEILMSLVAAALQIPVSPPSSVQLKLLRKNQTDLESTNHKINHQLTIN